jgi:hypothetical protein
MFWRSLVFVTLTPGESGDFVTRILVSRKAFEKVVQDRVNIIDKDIVLPQAFLRVPASSWLGRVANELLAIFMRARVATDGHNQYQLPIVFLQPNLDMLEPYCSVYSSNSAIARPRALPTSM